MRTVGPGREVSEEPGRGCPGPAGMVLDKMQSSLAELSIETRHNSVLQSNSYGHL